MTSPPALSPACLPLLRQGVVLGLSGGRDSVALLYLLVQQGVPVRACHVHHGIRGVEADGDAAFCQSLGERLGVPVELCCVDVPALAASQRGSLETVARQVRREALVDCARKHGVGVIALAHHADDQAETALFRLARGAAGWRAMQETFVAQGVTWVRPLLHCRRDALTRWLEEQRIPWREDATNAETDAARNKLRHVVLPALNEALGRDVTPVICRSARLQAEALEALDELLAEQPYKDPQGRLFLPYLEGKSEALRKAVIRRYLRECGVSDLSEEMVRAVDAILPPDARQHCLVLPGGRVARRSHRRLEISEKKTGDGDQA